MCSFLFQIKYKPKEQSLTLKCLLERERERERERQKETQRDTERQRETERGERVLGNYILFLSRS